MDWTELMVTIATADTETAAAIVQLAAGGGLYIEDYSDLEEQTLAMTGMDLIDEELREKDRTKSIIHIYIPPEVSPSEHLLFIGSRLEECKIPFSLSTGTVRELDWATAWKKYYHFIELSDKLAICPSWEDFSPREGQKVIRLDPGMAFGTGTHETTRLCLLLLEDYLKPHMTMLDVGCGSGILAICAKLLGSGRTVGVDIDPVAVRTAKENSGENSCDIQFVCGDLATDVKGSFDVICANIVADVILRLAGDIPALLNKDGIFIASGIIDTRGEEVKTGLLAAGLSPISVKEQGGWVAIACKLTNPKT